VGILSLWIAVNSLMPVVLHSMGWERGNLPLINYPLISALLPLGILCPPISNQSLSLLKKLP
jgi:hypothetical protein